MEYRQHLEYLEANRQTIETLIEKIEVQLSVHPYRQMLYKSADEESFRIVEGAHTPESCEGEEPQEHQAKDPVLRAAERNEDDIDDANKLVAGSMLGAFTLMRALKENEAPPFDLDGATIPLPYRHAIVRTTHFDDEHDPSVMGRIDAYEFFDEKTASAEPSAAHYYMRWEKDGIEKKVMLNLIDGKVAHVQFTVDTAEDDLWNRCYDMFGPDAKVMDLMDGYFETEHELDSNLQTIARVTKEIFPPDEVDAVLAEVRIRALRNKADLENLFETQSPPVAELKEFIAFLDTF